jgi:hypothetical protein
MRLLAACGVDGARMSPLALPRQAAPARHALIAKAEPCGRMARRIAAHDAPSATPTCKPTTGSD